MLATSGKREHLSAEGDCAMIKILFASMIAMTVACGGKGGGSTTPSGGGGGGGGGGDLGTVTITNSSSYDIYSIQLTQWDQTSWGANLLGDDVLMHGDSQKISVFDCEKYDLRMVDDEKVECVIQDIDLCFKDKDWTIDNTVLAVCATGWAD